MTKTAFLSAVNQAAKSAAIHGTSTDRIGAEKWARDQKAIIRIMVEALLNIQAGASRTGVMSAIKSAFKLAIVNNPSVESEIKAFRCALVKALEALDADNATPESIAECVNSFTQTEWRAFWRKPAAIVADEPTTDEPTTDAPETDATDTQRLAQILALLAKADDKAAMIEAIMAAAKA
tara:strand:+ start:2202 stop:2738 length:537 start_codon:yes stop_codon:yes gene_type:complete